MAMLKSNTIAIQVRRVKYIIRKERMISLQKIPTDQIQIVDHLKN